MAGPAGLQIKKKKKRDEDSIKGNPFGVAPRDGHAWWRVDGSNPAGKSSLIVAVLDHFDSILSGQSWRKLLYFPFNR
jgi:hypothetical protein